MSYRYATYRSESLLEPLQDEAHGSCDEEPSAAAVAKYVANNLAGLEQAVTDHATGSLVGASAPSAGGGSGRGWAAAVSGTAGLAAAGALLGVRAARARRSELLV